MKKILQGITVLALTSCAFSATAADKYILGGVGVGDYDKGGSETSFNLIAGYDINSLASIETSLNYANSKSSNPYAPTISTNIDYYTLAITPVIYFEPIPQLRLLAKAGAAYFHGSLTASAPASSSYQTFSDTVDKFMFTAGIAIQYQYNLDSGNQTLVRLGFDRYFHKKGYIDNLVLSVGYKF